MSHAGFGNVHGDIVNLATSGGAAPAFPPVEDDLRLPAQPKDVSDLRKGDVAGFNDEFLPGREAFPCVKLKPSATVTRALVAGRRVLSSYVQQGIRTLAASRRLHRCIVVVRDRVVVVDTRGRTASVHYGGGGVVKSNHHVVAFFLTCRSQRGGTEASSRSTSGKDRRTPRIGTRSRTPRSCARPSIGRGRPSRSCPTSTCHQRHRRCQRGRLRQSKVMPS